MIWFPMPIGNRFELEVAKICFCFGSLKGEYEVKSNQNNFYWIILNKALFLHLFSKWSKLTQFWLNQYKVNFDSSCGCRYTFPLQLPFHFLHEDTWKFDKQVCHRTLLFVGLFLLWVVQKPKSKRAIYNFYFSIRM